MRSLRDFELALDLTRDEFDDLAGLVTFVFEKLVDDDELADTFETVEEDVLLSKLFNKQIGSFRLLAGVVNPGELNDDLGWVNLSLGSSFCELNLFCMSCLFCLADEYDKIDDVGDNSCVFELDSGVIGKACPFANR